MRTFSIIVVCAMLSGCFGTSLKVKPYPEAPAELTVRAPTLVKLPDDADLIVTSKTITTNYTQYHIVAERLHKLQEWVQRIRKESLNVDGRTESSQEKIR